MIFKDKECMTGGGVFFFSISSWRAVDTDEVGICHGGTSRCGNKRLSIFPGGSGDLCTKGISSLKSSRS